MHDVKNLSQAWYIRSILRHGYLCAGRIFSESSVSLQSLTFKFTPDDIALLDALRAKTGIFTRTDVLRIALRRLAASEKLEWPPVEKAKSA
jgi:hypothetical protein